MSSKFFKKRTYRIIENKYQFDFLKKDHNDRFTNKDE